MALKMEAIRALADRVAASHGLNVVDVEYLGGGGKHRTLRIFIEKNEEERARLRHRVEQLRAAAEARGDEQPVLWEADEHEAGLEDSGEVELDGAELDELDEFDELEETEEGGPEESDAAFSDAAFLDGLPSVANLELLSGITHEDCEIFSRDFGVVLDVEELVPGTEYLLEVSSPGLDRKLTRVEDYRRFMGSLVKLQTFEPVDGNRHWQGRVTAAGAEGLVLALEASRGSKALKKAGKQGGKGGSRAGGSVEIAFGNIEKAHLVPEA
ncbi:MAG TPA: ribosome maturation factor RimP [Acidobacteriaceae bacterium]